MHLAPQLADLLPLLGREQIGLACRRPPRPGADTLTQRLRVDAQISGDIGRCDSHRPGNRSARSLMSPLIWASTRRRCVSVLRLQAQADSGKRADLLATQERQEIRKLRREVHELRRANEILKSASVFFAKESTQTERGERVCRGAARALRVERIRRTVGVTASAYDQRRTGERSVRAVEDERLLGRIVALHAANYFAYGYRRMWNALRRAGEHLPRCRVQRLMAAHGIQGAKRRGKPERTTKVRSGGAKKTRSSGTSLPHGRTPCGSAISRTCAAGRGRVLQRPTTRRRSSTMRCSHRSGPSETRWRTP